MSEPSEASPCMRTELVPGYCFDINGDWWHPHAAPAQDAPTIKETT